MTTSRIIRIPIEHVKAELATFPLASEKALELAIVDLCPKLTNSTAELWRKAEKKVIGHLPGFSVDEAISIRDFLWFARQPEKRIPLHYYLRYLAHEFLETQGAVAIPKLPRCLFPNGTDSRAHKPLSRQTWWWLSVSLPPDILLAALHNNTSRPERIEVVSPLLDQQLTDFGFAETHLHMGVGMDFRTLWIASLVAIADLDFKHDVFQSTGSELNEGKLLAPWLIRGAIMRYILAAYLCYGQQYNSLEEYIANEVRNKLGQACEYSGYSFLVQILSEMQQGKLFQTNNQERDYVSMQMLYKRLASPVKHCHFNMLSGVNTSDPIAIMYPQVRNEKVSSDLCFLSQSLRYLESKVQHTAQDKLFEKTFWQLIRIQSLLHRHIVQRPLTPGLQWFLRFYSHSSPIRKVFTAKDNIMSSAITSGLGHGLRSLELRTSPFAKNSDLLSFVTDVKKTVEDIHKKSKNKDPLEVGIVFHFIKERGGNAEKGEPVAHGRNGYADPKIDAVTRETIVYGNPQGYRFASFYLKKKREALSLIWLLKYQPSVLQIVRGLDVCTDEMAVPSWVLAPIVNEIREQSIIASSALRTTQALEIKPLHMTAHAGEDFIHLFSGLRNIDEAIEQFKLTQGDRIGHAVALGIEPKKWAKSSGKIPVKSEDRLFDLIWLWSCCGQTLKGQINPQQISMEHEIAILSNQIFTGAMKDIPSPYQLNLLRNSLCDSVQLDRVYFPLGSVSIEQCKGLKRDLLYQYLTSPLIFQQGQQIVWIDPSSEGELLLQVQNELRRKVGVIGITIEVNPSSNLLIGDLSDLESHPLWRLRPPIPLDGVPPVSICIGSDDPLIFSTDLRQEYQRVFDALITAGLSNEQAEQWVDQTRASGLNSRFTLPLKIMEMESK